MIRMARSNPNETDPEQPGPPERASEPRETVALRILGVTGGIVGFLALELVFLPLNTALAGASLFGIVILLLDRELTA